MSKLKDVTSFFLKKTILISNLGSMPIFWAAFLSSIVLTIMIWHTIKINIYNTAEINFNNLITESESSITKRLISYELALKGTVGLFNSSKKVTKNEWHSYISSLDISNNYNGMLEVGFIEYFKNTRSEIQNKLRAKNNNLNYKTKGQTKNKLTKRIKKERIFNEWTKILYLEPVNHHSIKLIGYDMFKDSLLNPIMTFARDSAKTCISSDNKINYFDSTFIGVSFIMFEPIYNGNSASLYIRKNKFLGYIYATIDMSSMVNSVFTNHMKHISIGIYEGQDSKTLLFADSNFSSVSNAKFLSKKYITFNNHKWQIVFKSLPDFESNMDSERPYLFLFAGFLISGLIFILSITVSSMRSNNLRLEQILATTDEGIFGLDINSNCSFINKSACNILGYGSEEVLNSKLHNIIHHNFTNAELYNIDNCPITLSIKKNRPANVSNEIFWTKTGTPVPVEYTSYPIIKNNNAIGAVITFRDITERKLFIGKLESSLNEKTILLKEVHHRVKNNLQIISSLLNLQAFQIKDDKIKTIFRESQNRVLSMALIHEKLYQSNNMNNIYFSEYLKELIDTLSRSYNSTDSYIDFELELIPINIGIDTSITLGLIVNEIISNSLKHAFAGRMDGKIKISLTKTDNSLCLKISDNGIGLPENFNYKETSSLGFNIIINLIEQINGSLVVKNINGTIMEITFPNICDTV